MNILEERYDYLPDWIKGYFNNAYGALRIYKKENLKENYSDVEVLDMLHNLMVNDHVENFSDIDFNQNDEWIIVDDNNWEIHSRPDYTSALEYAEFWNRDSFDDIFDFWERVDSKQ